MEQCASLPSRGGHVGFQLQALRQRALEEVPVPSHDELADGFPAFRHCGQCSERVAVQSATEQARRVFSSLRP